MFRSTSSILALLAAMTLPALGADYSGEWDGGGDDGPDFRSTYPMEPGDWAGLGDDDDPIAIETGIRYWYARGAQDISSGGNSVSSTDTAHIGELHLRIEDHSTNSYAAAIAGYSAAMSGSVTTPMGTNPIVDGHVAYLGGDIGWQAWSDGNGTGIGPMAGYLYWQDEPDTGRFNYTTLSGGGAVPYDSATGQTFVPLTSAPNSINAHVLRLGISGKAKLGDIFDVTATVAGVPYAKVGGAVGVEDPGFSTTEYAGPAQPPYGGAANGNVNWIRSSPTSIDGWGYGAMVEGFVGVRPVEQLTVRLGGRLWYLQGTADATYDAVSITDPGPPGGPVYNTAPTVVEQSWISTNNPFRMLRYGLMLEATYAF